MSEGLAASALQIPALPPASDRASHRHTVLVIDVIALPGTGAAAAAAGPLTASRLSARLGVFSTDTDVSTTESAAVMMRPAGAAPGPYSPISPDTSALGQSPVADGHGESTTMQPSPEQSAGLSTDR